MHAPASPDQQEDTASFPVQHMGGMDHDMSDPVLARAMEVDMRTRFFVALVLTIPVVPYSSLGLRLFGVHVPTPFGVNSNWVLLILSTPIVWWYG
jgi:Cu2+-exporting ATPase